MSINKSIFFSQNVSKQLGYGYLYNWYAVSNSNFAPTDWKVPTGDVTVSGDYYTLRAYLGGPYAAGGKLKETGLIHWDSPNSGATNSSGFFAYGAGHRRGDTGLFGFINKYTWFHSATSGESLVKIINLSYLDAIAYIGSVGNAYGLSVRLLYTGAGTPTTLTDYDGNIYDVVVIGTQRWIVQNWKCIHLNDGTPITKITSNIAWTGATSGGYCAYDNDDMYA